MFGSAALETALSDVGALLSSRGHQIEIVAIGGGGLLLLGLITRPTNDCDVVAILDDGVLRRGQPLPASLREASIDVARQRGLREDWLNAGPASLVDLGLPAGLLDRTERRDYDGLIVHLASRLDQIHFKLYAAADDSPGGKHAADLRALHPTRAELEQAAAWARTHDPSPGFALILAQVIEHVLEAGDA